MMKKISYKIFKGERSKNYSFEIPTDLYEFLNNPVLSISSNKLISKDTFNKMDKFQSDYFDIYYTILDEILDNTLGIKSDEIDDLTVEDFGRNEIIVHVYLSEE